MLVCCLAQQCRSADLTGGHVLQLGHSCHHLLTSLGAIKVFLVSLEGSKAPSGRLCELRSYYEDIGSRSSAHRGRVFAPLCDLYPLVLRQTVSVCVCVLLPPLARPTRQQRDKRGTGMLFS